MIKEGIIYKMRGKNVRDRSKAKDSKLKWIKNR